MPATPRRAGLLGHADRGRAIGGDGLRLRVNQQDATRRHHHLVDRIALVDTELTLAVRSHGLSHAVLVGHGQPVALTWSTWVGHFGPCAEGSSCGNRPLFSHAQLLATGATTRRRRSARWVGQDGGGDLGERDARVATMPPPRPSPGRARRLPPARRSPGSSRTVGHARDGGLQVVDGLGQRTGAQHRAAAEAVEQVPGEGPVAVATRSR